MAATLCAKRLVSARFSLLKTPKRNGYVVLVPEIGEDLPEKNPLLKEDGLPEFNQFTIEKCIATICRQTVEFEQEVKNVEKYIQAHEEVDLFKDALGPIEELKDPLETTWGISKVLFYGNQSLMPTKYYYKLHTRAVKSIGQRLVSVPIYRLCKKVLENDKNGLTEEQMVIVRKYVLEGRLNGIDITGRKVKTFNFDLQRIYSFRDEFNEKLKISTNLFKHTIDNPNVMKDFPEDFLKLIALDPSQPYRGPWTVTLKPYIYEPFLEYCPDRDMRLNIWEANVTRSSLYNDSSLQTSTPLEEIRFMKTEQAQILGYKHYAHMSMETKMAGSLDVVYNFLDTLLATARPAQEEELASLSEFAAERGFNGHLRQWDVPYWSRKQLRSVHNYKEEVIREYFSLPNVLDSLFQLLETLFDLKIVENKRVDVWHQDVRFFNIFDLTESSIEPVAGIYLDPYARLKGKVDLLGSEGLMITMRSKCPSTQSTPLAALIFCFQPPSDGKPSLLTFKEVLALFEKTGLALQHSLSKVNYSEVAGSTNVEWDIVKTSGQLLANWAYEPSLIRQFGTHYKTGEQLPDELVESIKYIKLHLAGYKLCQELYLSRFDLELYSKEEFWVPMMKRLWKMHFVIPEYRKDSHICSFSEIFTSEWGAAYYSGIWSRMIAADIYSAFQEVPAGDKAEKKKIAERFRDTFLFLGGAYKGREKFRRFRGRDPNPTALLKSLGLTAQRDLDK
ncbi:probable cytosolic oligopeptidase A [Orussus abietinus]|uniref:probable cytosolic oligopeptidase A n=1 Tax=Orussus abietinus TaxID=222816 RepID=UPI0006254A05|nr:probable cytosolic oligopeptidase A [Orussus abietinus]